MRTVRSRCKRNFTGVAYFLARFKIKLGMKAVSASRLHSLNSLCTHSLKTDMSERTLLMRPSLLLTRRRARPRTGRPRPVPVGAAVAPTCSSRTGIRSPVDPVPPGRDVRLARGVISLYRVPRGPAGVPSRFRTVLHTRRLVIAAGSVFTPEAVQLLSPQHK